MSAAALVLAQATEFFVQHAKDLNGDRPAMRYERDLTFGPPRTVMPAHKPEVTVRPAIIQEA